MSLSRAGLSLPLGKKQPLSYSTEQPAPTNMFRPGNSETFSCSTAVRTHSVGVAQFNSIQKSRIGRIKFAIHIAGFWEDDEACSNLGTSQPTELLCAGCFRDTGAASQRHWNQKLKSLFFVIFHYVLHAGRSYVFTGDIMMIRDHRVSLRRPRSGKAQAQPLKHGWILWRIAYFSCAEKGA